MWEMMKEHDSAETIRFRAEREFLSHEGEGEGEEARWFEASVELANSHIKLVLDGSEYDFTAQQCGELADGLSTLVKTLYQRSAIITGIPNPLILDFGKLFHQLIVSRTQSTQQDWLCNHGYDLDGMFFGVSGSFRYPDSQSYFQLFIGVNDELFVPILGIEDRVFTFSVEDASWLIEQLCVGGYLLARIESASEE
ncbi:hypothetical protein IFR08_17565 [Pseudomonas fluorescens]|nr:hypothetical protein [Pseudomonas fluorescens]MBD8100418.1 hypothetical protein [Pseudomonas fluorescens]MBD8775542.1 hypothetical protein [Pseudomonas fluorescens]MBD8782060.1 hypothetical protein [Pseudomonas fluorescens]MBD8794728.1 hypothetical protein [Pseudomonas fluorescens]